MVTLRQIQHGITRYADTQIMPKMPDSGGMDGLKRLGVGIATAYISRNIGSLLEKYRGNQFLSALGVIDSNGDVDIEGIAEIAKEEIPESGIRVTVPILNELTFYRADVDSLLSYIVGG